MSIKAIGLVLVGIGAAILAGGGGLPNRGVREFKKLVSAYRIEKREGREPTVEQKGAFYTYCSYLVGGCLVSFGFVFLLVAFLVGE